MTKFNVEDTSGSAPGGFENVSFTVSSDFGGDDVLEVTVVLQSSRYGGQGNTFYDKHILRKDEDPAEILAIRNSGKMGAASYDPGLASAAHGMGIKSTGAPASTVVSLRGMNYNKMIFEFADALVAAYRTGVFVAQDQNYDVEVEFSTAQCVLTARKSGAIERAQGIKVGAQLNAEAGDQLTFSINHCAGATD